MFEWSLTMLKIRTEIESDFDSIREINCAAFGGDAEARLVDALRDGAFSRVSLVADVNRLIVGHILFSELQIVTSMGNVPALSLAPMAVLPNMQRHGIGTELVRSGLAACRDQGYGIVIVLGYPEFYSRFGFSAELARPLSSAYSGEAFMAVELTAGALDGIDGTVKYPPPFAEL